MRTLPRKSSSVRDVCQLTKAQKVIFVQELRFALRADGDVGAKRTITTPEPKVIYDKLCMLYNRFSDNLSATTKEEINKLKSHALRGCLR